MDYLLWRFGIPLLLIIILFVCSLVHRRRLVQNLIWAQLNNKSTSTFFINFQDSAPEQLLYPLTSAQLACIRSCRRFERTIATVKGIRPMDGLMNDLYFTVHYDVCGTDASGKTFVIQEDAYLRVCFRRRGQVIYWIVGSREPF